MLNNSSFSPLMTGNEKPEGKGPLALVIIVIIFILVGGIYAMNSGEISETETMPEVADQFVGQDETEATSTNLDDIETDINKLEAETSNVDLEGLDKEINSI